MQSPLGLIDATGNLVPFEYLTQEQIDTAGNVARENAALKAENDELKLENIDLKRRLAPDLGPILEALKTHGLYDWMAEAAKIDPNLLDEIAAMSAAAASGDIPSLISNYAAIVAVHPPTAEQLTAWQGVLDAANVPHQILAFVSPGNA